jgi:methionine-rich copper-binding protein CopC
MRNVLRTLSVTALAAAAGTTFAHAKLQAAEPANGIAVAAPAEVKLHFNEAVEPAMSTIKVYGPGHAAVEVGKPAGASEDPKTLVSTLPKLAAGEYRLEWSTMGHDGHHTKGEYRFTVK